MSSLAPPARRILGCKRPRAPVARLLATSDRPLDRLKVHRNHKNEWSHSDLPFTVNLDKWPLACAAILGGYTLYRSIEIVPVGTIGAKPDKEIVEPGWHLAPPWTPRIQQYSTQQQSLQSRTRVMDSKNIKVFVTLLVQYQLNDPKLYFEQQQPPKPFSFQQILEDPRAYWEQHCQDGPTQLQTLVQKQTQQVLEKVLEKESILDVEFGVRGRSVLELGDTLAEKLGKEGALKGIIIHRVTVSQLEVPHWVNDHIEAHMRKSWTMETFVEQRKQKRIELKKEGKEKLKKYIQEELKKDGEEENDDGKKE